MSYIEREYNKRRKAVFPIHKVIERDGRRAYVRDGRPPLMVWTVQGCVNGLQSKTPEAIKTWFNQQVATMTQYKTPPVDPMLMEWFEECYNAASKAYDILVAARVVAPIGINGQILSSTGWVNPPVPLPVAEEVEEFGVFELEEFGV